MVQAWKLTAFSARAELLIFRAHVKRAFGFLGKIVQASFALGQNIKSAGAAENAASPDEVAC